MGSAAGGAKGFFKLHQKLGQTMVGKVANAPGRVGKSGGGNVLSKGETTTPGSTIRKGATGAKGMIGLSLNLARQTDPAAFKAAGLKINKQGNIMFPNRITTPKKDKLGSGL
jgi:hypothetical protein